MKLDINYKQKRIETVITIAVGFVLIGAVISWRSEEIVFWPLFISVPVLILGLSFKQLGLFITIGWFKLSQAMGWVSSKVILTFLYFLFITPYGWLNKLFSKRDVLGRKQKTTTFLNRDKYYEPKDFENPW